MKRKSLKGIDVTDITYIPETGEFSRKHRQTGKIQTIKPTPTKKGYLRAKIDGRNVMLHALAYYMMTGEDPIEIDHINRDPSDNRWCNLRNCTRNTNMFNSSRSTGGVVFRKDGKRIRRYKASIKAFGRYVHLGVYDNDQDATRAYIKAIECVEEQNEEKLKALVSKIMEDQRIVRSENSRKAAYRFWGERKDRTDSTEVVS